MMTAFRKEFSLSAFAVTMGLSFAIFFGAVLLGLKSFYFRDYGLFGYPIAVFFKQSVWNGEWPFWNPYNNCGVPFLAQWNTLTLYPGSLIYLLLPLPWSLNLFLLLHLFFGGIGMFKLALEWTGSRNGAALAGAGYVFNGLALNCLMWPNNMAAWGWIPWVLLLVRRACLELDRRSLSLAVLAGGLQMLTGAPEMIFLTWCMAAFLSLAENSSTALFRRKLGALAAVGAGVAGLAAIQLLPFLHLLRLSERGAGYADASWSMPGWGLLHLLLPLFGSERSPSGVYLQSEQGWTSSYYPGILVLLFACCALPRSTRRVRWLFGLNILGLILALGKAAGVYGLLMKIAPGLAFLRFPIKFVVLSSAAFPLLAAYGVAALSERNSNKPLINSALALGTLLIAALATVYSWGIRGSDMSLLLSNGALRLLFLAGAVLLFLRRQQLGSFFAGASLVLLTSFDVATHMPWQNPTVDATTEPRALAPGFVKLDPQPALGQSRAMLTPFALNQLRRRMLSDPRNDYLCHRLGLHNNCNLLEGIPKVDGFYSLSIKEEMEIRTALYTGPDPAALPLLDFLGVAQINPPGQVLEWQRRPRAMPLLTGGQTPLPMTGLDSVLSPRFAPSREVFLSDIDLRGLPALRGTNVTFRNAERKLNSLTAEVIAPAAALVVFAETCSPNWKASVDGAPARIFRANHAFQAVLLPAGTHSLRFAYKERTFWPGALLSALTASLLVAGLFTAPARRG